MVYSRVFGDPHLLQVMGYVQCLVTHIIALLTGSSTASKAHASISWRLIVWGAPSPSVSPMMPGVQERHRGQKLWPSRYEEGCNTRSVAPWCFLQNLGPTLRRECKTQVSYTSLHKLRLECQCFVRCLLPSSAVKHIKITLSTENSLVPLLIPISSKPETARQIILPLAGLHPGKVK
jgi:hypothetical protein